MRMEQDGVRVDCLPDNAHCEADEMMRSPLDMEECPLGCEKCSGDCLHYVEE